MKYGHRCRRQLNQYGFPYYSCQPKWVHNKDNWEELVRVCSEKQKFYFENRPSG